MDLKHIIIGEALLLVLVMSSCYAGKRKRTSLSSKHVTHVSSKQTIGVNSLQLTNTNNIQPGKKSIKTSKRERTIKEIRRLIVKKKKKLIRNPKKRKRVLRKLRNKLRELKRNKRSKLKKCKSSKDCEIDECCIKKFTLKEPGRCRKRPKLKQRCRPALLPGLDINCPCRYGLTCMPFTYTKKGFYKFRCEKLKQLDEELDPQAITGLGRFK